MIWMLLLMLYGPAHANLNVPDNGSNKTVGLAVDTNVNQPTAVKIKFPSRAGCEVAVKAAAKLGYGVCLEIR